MPANTLFKTAEGIEFQTADDLILSIEGKGDVTAYATNTGSTYNVPANTIIYQVEPTSDIISVTNNEPVESGANSETDLELANRIRIANDTRPSSPANGIISAVMEVAGVKTVQVVQNNNLTEDEFGNPPKTIHVYVDGGDEERIADALFNSVSAGIQTVGSKQQAMTDNAGFSDNVIAFDYAQQSPIYVSIAAQTNLDFETEGIQQIKNAVNDYLVKVPMGGIVRFSYLYKYVYDNVPGIDVIEVKIGVDKDSLSMADVQLEQFAIPVTTSESLMVTENA